MLQHWKVLILILFVLASVLAIGVKQLPYGREGVEVVYVSRDSPAHGILEQGMLITFVNGKPVKSLEEWTGFVSGFKGNLSIRANGQDRTIIVNDSLGVNVLTLQRTNLDFGLDLRGGTRVILQPTSNATMEEVEQAISILQTRANLFGLREMRFAPAGQEGAFFILIEAAGVGSDVVENLLSTQGKFEAKIVKPVDIVGNSGKLVLGTKSFDVSESNGTVRIGGITADPGGRFSLEGIDFEYRNRTGNRLTFLGTAYTGDDIELVYTDPQRSGFTPQQGGAYSFFFAVLVSEDGSRRFADITAGIPRYFDVNAGEEYLDSSIVLFVDNQEVSSLRISASLGGQIVNTPQIQGVRESYDDAVDERLRLQTILRSGALPTTLSVASVDTISPTLGAGFVTSALYAAMIAVIAVIIIVFVRYRSLGVVIPLAFVSFSEIIIILGIASAGNPIIWGSVLVIGVAILVLALWRKHEVDYFAWAAVVIVPLIGMSSWTFDLPAIGGIIAALGTGVDHQIIIADETLRRKKEKAIYNLKERIKRAFFIIFGAAATTIAAMLPLMFIGVGLVRGFAITTIVGILIGVLVTRPAYGRIIESIAGRKQD